MYFTKRKYKKYIGDTTTEKRIVINTYMKMYKIKGVEGIDTLYTGEILTTGDVISFRDKGNFVVEGRRFYMPVDDRVPVDGAVMQNGRIVFEDDIKCSTLILKKCETC